MNTTKITKVAPSEINQLQQISKQTFSETFSESNTEKNLLNYLEKNLSKEKLWEELANTDSQFYFAETDRKITGYLKVNFGDSQTELKDSSALEIERIYVVNEYHGKGIAQVLYAKAIDTANDLGAEYVWLGVWEENQRAISFYKKNGFVEFDKHIFKLGDDEQTDIMMKLKL
ncbi:GNAT family N-acetyltransferase [Flavobacterium qiangtangense]|uniref:GNAT family N-acetyltransferase n=1 Tax=Flavobacterium qiangtangense TaxID=1442595 RepID=A0ABW1PIT4_9FLAO